MTVNPPSLLAVRALLQPHLALSAVELGISGDAKHRGGYHQGKDKVDLTDYSVRESPRDRAGLSDYASAEDIGYWSKTVRGKRHDLRSMSIWLVAQCKAGKPDTHDIREIIYSPDGEVVRRWDRLAKRDDGDDSHLSHTHISFFRDAIKAGRDQRPLFARYLIEIGLLEDDVTADETWNWHWAGERKPDGTEDKTTAWTRLRQIGQGLDAVAKRLDKLATAPGELTDADRADIAAKVLAGLPEGLADQLADKLAARLQD